MELVVLAFMALGLVGAILWAIRVNKKDAELTEKVNTTLSQSKVIYEQNKTLTDHTRPSTVDQLQSGKF